MNIQPMTTRSIAMVRELEQFALSQPQVEVVTHHLIHAGVYHRTVMLPAGTLVTGALIKVPTTLTVCGHVTVLIGMEEVELEGYHILPAAADRKQGFVVHADTVLTMSFRTSATSVDEAEREFTDELDLLVSRLRPDLNRICITGAT